MEYESPSSMSPSSMTSTITQALPDVPPLDQHQELSFLFRQYDIRGRIQEEGTQGHNIDEWPASPELSPRLAFALGCAIGAELHRAPSPPQEWHFAIGYDSRLSGPSLAHAVELGLRRMNVHVIHLGLVPTPVVYFATHHLPKEGLPCHGGVMITGSHNPKGWNGFKINLGENSIYGERLQEIALRILKADYQSFAGQPLPTRSLHIDLSAVYLREMKARLTLPASRARSLKVILDSGHGAAGPLATRLFTELGFQVSCLYEEPDGRFPAHHPDPTIESNLENLKEEVLRTRADIGIGFDGDGDRIGVIDRQGEVIWGDLLLLLLAEPILQKTPGVRIIGEVKCSQLLFDGIQERGGIPEMWRVGHSLIKARMRETDAPIAGEMSGHIFFADRFYGYDDAIYVAGRVLERLCAPYFDLNAWRTQLPTVVNTPEIKVWCADKDKTTVIQRVQEYFRLHYPVSDVDGARVQFEGGWALVRASNTQPVLVMRYEARDELQLQKIRAEVEAWIKAHAPEVRFDVDPNH